MRDNRLFCFSKDEKKILYDENGKKHVSNISPYLIEAPNIIVQSRSNPICSVPKMFLGNKPSDGGNLILSEEERNDIIQKELQFEKFIHQYIGAEEFIKGKTRYCLWLKKVTPHELAQSQELKTRLKKVKAMREASSAAPTREKASTPHLFFFISQPEK